MEILKPPALRRGDVIGLVAPASPPPSAERVQAGVTYLEGLGYHVKPGKHVARRHGFFAGTDAERAADLNGMFADPQVRAIFAIRGGYGTPRILPAIDFGLIRRHPKIFVGYSDVTALQLALFRKIRLVTFSGPMVASDFGAGIDPFTEEQFWRMVATRRKAGRLPHPPGQPLRALQPGRAEGRLLGGTLALLVSNLATPYSPDYRDAILVLEDINEHLHRVDRMLTQLRNAGILGRLRGLALGAFTDCEPVRGSEPHLKLPAIFREVLAGLDLPTVDGLAYGHPRPRLTLPWGVLARLDTRRGSLDLLESPTT